MDRIGVSVLKNILMLIFIFSTSFANNSIAVLKAKIIKNIAEILVKKKVVRVYVTDPNFYDIFRVQNDFKKAISPKYADIILTNNSIKYENLKHKPCIISTNYKDYKNHTDIDWGAFFWQKGRPNIILNAKILKQKHIKIPMQYDNYVE